MSSGSDSTEAGSSAYDTLVDGGKLKLEIKLLASDRSASSTAIAAC